MQAWAYYDADCSPCRGKGISDIREIHDIEPQGYYRVTFKKRMADANYTVLVTPDNWNHAVGGLVQDRSKKGFTVVIINKHRQATRGKFSVAVVGK